ncbi:MAG: putative beta-lysine N-acetyltransferase [Clostridiaceae bacterium]|nr:putative beta-lysine N-acetyltransferase [Clostridiaceae bacterium]
MNFDRIENLDGAVIHHGPSNNRIYLLNCPENKLSGIHEPLLSLAEKNGYGKIILKIPAKHFPFFGSEGYTEEAHIPGFYDGTGDCVFAAYYLDPARQLLENDFEIQSILEQAKQRPSGRSIVKPCPSNCIVEELNSEDANNVARLYRDVFATYPFPIHDPDYILSTMNSHVIYFGVKQAHTLIAVSSIEADPSKRNGEMTDFATLPGARGKGLAGLLLRTMHEKFEALGYLTAYTIARAVSPGMNYTFSSAGYTYGGTLINNTQISGQLESMNIWYKHFDCQ